MRHTNCWGIMLFIITLPQISFSQCVSGNCQDGYGVFLYENNGVYAGQFKHGQRHGQGTFTDNQGNLVYSGYWSEEEGANRLTSQKVEAVYACNSTKKNKSSGNTAEMVYRGYSDRVAPQSMRPLAELKAYDTTKFTRGGNDMPSSSSGANEKYVDAEHAYYNAPLRASEMFQSFKQSATKDDYYIVIEKSKYVLHVYDARGKLVANYPIVLGNDDLGDKMAAGDRETPEGTFHIVSKKVHSLWHKYLGIDYPNADSYAKFEERKRKGLIPENVNAGGGIGLHGTWPNEDITVDREQNWTSGCVSTKNCYIDELYAYIPVGTTVIIRK